VPVKTRFSRGFFYFVLTYVVIRDESGLISFGEGRMAESCGWVFVDNVPLLYDRRRVARQLQVETWLELSQLVRELKMGDLEPGQRGARSTAGYIA
jgi:hypothetical protein